MQCEDKGDLNICSRCQLDDPSFCLECSYATGPPGRSYYATPEGTCAEWYAAVWPAKVLGRAMWCLHSRY